MPRKGAERDERVCVASKTKHKQRGKSLKQIATACSWLLPEYAMRVHCRDEVS